MATNKINFNNSTVTLNGVYYNGVKIEGCKGIKLNGDIIVSFETIIPELEWSDYTTAYNSVWSSTDTTFETNKMAKMTAENEFAICRSAWMLYKSKTAGLFYNGLGGEDAQLFNFNADGRLYTDETSAANWETLSSYTDPITIASPHNQIPLYRMLTGFPLIYKTEGGEFAGTFICSGSETENIYHISYGEYWTIFVEKGRFSEIISYEGEALTTEDIAEAIRNTLGVEAVAQGSAVEVTGSAGWGEFEFLDALSQVYVPKFGPFYENVNNMLQDDELYHLSPNEIFNDGVFRRPYWNARITNDIIIKNAWITTTPCDFYILTGWGLQYILEKTESSIDDYFTQGESNAEVNITYFDTSCFAGLQYPNILCNMNSSYSGFRPDYIFTSGNWAGIYKTDDYGLQTTAPIFPTDCPYDIGSLTLSDLDSVLPNATTQWIAENNLQNAKVTCALNQTTEADYEDGSDIIPASIANDVFNQYQQVYPTNFPYNNPSNPTKTVKYALKLKMRTYPSYASVSGGTEAAESKWYLDAYDPYNVGGYYPVKKTTATAAGNKYSTVCNYTAQ